MSEKFDVGVIGLGIMGSAMAKNLAKAGHSVAVWNRNAQKALALNADGCTAAATPRDMADACEATVLMVTDPAACDAVLEGKDGWFSGNCNGRLLVNMSTVSADYTKELAARCAKKKVRFIDCPVAGSKGQAEAAQLILLAGGSQSEVEAAKPWLLHMGKTVIYAGPAGNGSALKLCINLIIAQMSSCLCESVTLADLLKIDPKLIFDVLHESPVLDCGYYRIKEKNLLAKNYAPAFSLANVLKDVKFMLAQAQGAGGKLPVTEAVRELLQQGYDAGRGDKDLSIMAETLREMKK
jgi:3-hydroxyisobutyrate dehydrogenase-like beta-hydroxyacid dehydrogenase